MVHPPDFSSCLLRTLKDTEVRAYRTDPVQVRAQDEGVVAELVVLDVEVALPHRADYSIICPRLVGGHQWKMLSKDDDNIAHRIK
ncbi:hypothetical protein ACSQ67_000629 [Phaseolus vulgaris]